MMAAGAPALRPGPLGHGGLPGLAPAGRPDDRGRPGEPEDGPGAAPDLRPDARAQVGALDGRLRLAAAACSTTTRSCRASTTSCRSTCTCPAARRGRRCCIDAILKLREKIMHEPLGAERPQDARGPQGARRRAGRGARRDAVVATASTRPGAPSGSKAVARGPRGAAADRELDEGAEPPPRQVGAEVTHRPTSRTTAGAGAARRRSAPPAAPRPSYPPASPAGRGMFGIQGTGDTSGFGGLVRRRTPIVDGAPAVRRLLRRGRRRAGGGVPGLRRRDREGRRRPGRADPAHRARSGSPRSAR